MSRVIIWRHGQTAWNASGKIQGQADIELDAVGWEQAAAAADCLAALRPTQIISSDLSRAAQTAQTLAKVTGIEVSYDIRLRERCYGPWQGLTVDEISQRWPEHIAVWRSGAPDIGLGIESLDEVAYRAAAAFTDGVDPDGVTVLVTHGATARQGCAQMLGWPRPLARTLGGLGNCHWTELRLHPITELYPVGGWWLCAHNSGP